MPNPKPKPKPDPNPPPLLPQALSAAALVLARAAVPPTPPPPPPPPAPYPRPLLIQFAKLILAPPKAISPAVGLPGWEEVAAEPAAADPEPDTPPLREPSPPPENS